MIEAGKAVNGMPGAFWVMVGLSVAAALVRHAEEIGAWVRRLGRVRPERVEFRVPPLLPVPENDDAWEEVAPGIFRKSH